MWSREECVKRKPSDEHVFVLTPDSVHLFQHTCEQYGAHLYCPRSQPKTTFRFLHGDPKTQKSARERPCEVVLRGPECLACSTTTSHTGVPQPRHATHGEASLRWKTVAEITLEEQQVCCRGGEITPATHLPTETSYRILVRTKGLCHVTPGSKLRVEHITTQTQVIRRFSHGANSTKDVDNVIRLRAGGFATILPTMPRHVA